MSSNFLYILSYIFCFKAIQRNLRTFKNHTKKFKEFWGHGKKFKDFLRSHEEIQNIPRPCEEIQELSRANLSPQSFITKFLNLIGSQDTLSTANKRAWADLMFHQLGSCPLKTTCNCYMFPEGPSAGLVYLDGVETDKEINLSLLPKCFRNVS